jgi:diaminopimelate decarboxylase
MIDYQGGRLHLDGHPIEDFADRLTTPFFVFGERSIRANYDTLAKAFAALPSGCGIDYAVKCNYELPLLRLIAELGAGAMVSCGWELELALDAGLTPEHISFQGPVKTLGELEALVRLGIGLVHVASEQEIERVDQIAAAFGRPVRISLRLQTPASDVRRGLVGWLGQRLGIPWDRAEAVWRRASSSSWLHPVGVGLYVGTQVLDPGRYHRAFRQQIRLAERLQDQGLPVLEITLGGGWPSNTLQPLRLDTIVRLLTGRETASPSDRLGKLARRVARDFRDEIERSSLISPPALRLESGRGLIGTAGLLVTTVLAIAGSWVFVDATRNLLPESRFVGLPLVMPMVRRVGEQRRYHVSGRTVNTMDVLALSVRLPVLRVGDVLVFSDAGAYALSRASRYAGSIPDAYLLRGSGELDQVRRHDEYRDIVANMLTSAEGAAWR